MRSFGAEHPVAGHDGWGAMTSKEQGDGGTAAGQIAVFLLDDHEIVRRGVRDLLEAEPDIRVVGEAGTASSALARLPALRTQAAAFAARLPRDSVAE
jgi:two-component system, NarL family, response regulator DevR